MNQKYNPWLSLVALLLMALILVFTCTGCTAEAAAAGHKTVDRFTVEYAGHNCEIITDNETGVQYLAYVILSNYGRGVGLCKLEG